MVKGISKLKSLDSSSIFDSSISVYSKGSSKLTELILFDDSLFPIDFGPLIAIKFSKSIMSFSFLFLFPSYIKLLFVVANLLKLFLDKIFYDH